MNTLLKIATVSALATLAACSTRTVTREVVREQPIVQQVAPERERVVVVQQPAVPTETVPPAPAATGYSWVAGYYEWRDNTWVWRPGQWVVGTVRPVPPAVQETLSSPPTAGSRWVPGYWQFAGNDWVWVRGRWL